MSKPKKQSKKSVAEESVVKKKGRGDASSNGGKRQYPKVRKPVAVRCKAKNRFGKPCGLPPIKGAAVCHKHGGSTKQVKVKAAERLEAARQEMLIMLEPLLGRISAMVLDPNTTDADIVKVFREVANRVGLSERHVIVPGAETAFDRLGDLGAPGSAFIMRGGDLREALEGDHPAELPTHNSAGQGADNDHPFDGGGDDDLEAFLEHRERRRQQEATTHISHGDHDVVTGEVIQRPAEDPFRMDEKARAEYERSRSEYGPPAPKDDPARAYEDRLREGIEDR